MDRTDEKTFDEGALTVTVTFMHIDTVRRMDPRPLYIHMPKRMEKADRFRHETGRLHSMGAGFLMREAAGIRDESMLSYGKNGKPFVPGHPGFNLSHSGGWCVLALAGGTAQIGVDIEEVRTQHLNIAHFLFTDQEQAWIESEPGSYAGRFYTLWTLKESVMKATGEGLGLMRPSAFCVLPFIRTPGSSITIAGSCWYGMHIDSPSGSRCGLCSDRPVSLVRLRVLTQEGIQPFSAQGPSACTAAENSENALQ